MYVAVADGVASLPESNPETEFTFGHDDWPAAALAKLPAGVETEDLSNLGEE